MCGFEDIVSKGHFQPKKGGIGGQNPLAGGGSKNFLGQNNSKNEFSTIKLLRVQIFSKIHYLRGIFNIFGVKNAPQGGELEFLST